jgi:uncharacterized spore protein YtfJ
MGSAENARGGHVDLVTEAARDALTVRRVFGEPVAHGDVTVIPVARVRGGHGIGFWSGALRSGGAQVAGEDGPHGPRGGRGDGGAGGLGVDVRPAGVYVIHGEDAEWHPALDVTRIALGGQAVAVVAILAATRLARRRSAPRGPVPAVATASLAPLVRGVIRIPRPRLARRAAAGTARLLAAALRRRG